MLQTLEVDAELQPEKTHRTLTVKGRELHVYVWQCFIGGCFLTPYYADTLECCILFVVIDGWWWCNAATSRPRRSDCCARRCLPSTTWVCWQPGRCWSLRSEEVEENEIQSLQVVDSFGSASRRLETVIHSSCMLPMGLTVHNVAKWLQRVQEVICINSEVTSTASGCDVESCSG